MGQCWHFSVSSFLLCVEEHCLVTPPRQWETLRTQLKCLHSFPTVVVSAAVCTVQDNIRHVNICAGIYFNVMLFPEVWRLPTLIINTDVCRTLGPLFSSAVEPKHPAPGDASFLWEVKFPNNLLHVTATSAPNSSRSWYFRLTSFFVCCPVGGELRLRQTTSSCYDVHGQ